MGKKITTIAFVTGAVVGSAAGLMNKIKNRQRVVRAGKQTKRKLEILASEGIDFTRDKFTEVSANIQKRD